MDQRVHFKHLYLSQVGFNLRELIRFPLFMCAFEYGNYEHANNMLLDGKVERPISISFYM